MWLGHRAGVEAVVVLFGGQMILHPLDGGMAERCDSEEASVPSDVRRWSAHEGWVGWEEEWQAGVIRRYYRSWLLFRLPRYSGDVRAVLRVRLNRGDSNSGPLEVAVYRTLGDEWTSDGDRLGSLGVLRSFEPRWLELDLPLELSLPGEGLHLELRAAEEQTRGYGTRRSAAFDLLPPAAPAELVLHRVSDGTGLR